MFKKCNFAKRWIYRDDRIQHVDVMYGILLLKDEPYIYAMSKETGAIDFNNNLSGRAFEVKQELVALVSKQIYEKIKDCEEVIAEWQRKLQLLEE